MISGSVSSENELSKLTVNSSENEFIELTDSRVMVTGSVGIAEPTNKATVQVNIPQAIDNRTTIKNKSSRLRQCGRLKPILLNSLLIFIVLSLLILLEYGFIPGNQQGYYCQDPQISYKYKGEIVSPLILGIGTFSLPLIVLILTEYLSGNTWKLNYRRLWYFYKECMIGCVLVLLLTEVTKILIGEHRPHFFDVCQPDTARGCIKDDYVEKYECTNRNYSRYFLMDSSRSFPSGHSSISWFISTFSAYVVQTRLSTTHTGYIMKPFLIAVCFTWSLLCSLTRITDRRHHWWDVLAGSTLGVLGAIYTIKLIQKKVYDKTEMVAVAASTSTLIDIKNKNATSHII